MNDITVKAIELLNKMSPKYKELEDFDSNWDDARKVEWGMQKAYNHDFDVIQRAIAEKFRPMGETTLYTEKEVRGLIIEFSPSLRTIEWFERNKKE